jgi:hypothetical protein
MTKDEQIREVAKCFRSPIYFITNYCWIYDATTGEWIPFYLWPEQKVTLRKILNNLLVVILKARQLGLTWLVLGFALWLMLFRPAATVLIFSRRDDEAVYLLDDRLKGMFDHLPEWLVHDIEVITDNDHEWELSNGSVARAFPTSAGDSYTATMAIVDEADLVQDLNRLMRAVKPTIDSGGRMILLSRSDKTRPNSEYKAIYRGAKRGLSPWVSVFLPWFVRPERDRAWYEVQKQDIQTRTGSLDDLHEQYPATDTEALSPRTMDKRIPSAWLEKCYGELDPIGSFEDGPAIHGLEIYVRPNPNWKYVIGVDPAEGNPTSDDSALTVMEQISGEEMAVLAGKFQPSTLADYADQIGRYFNNAALMVERNNHGHAVLLWLRDNSSLTILSGHDGKEGWMSSTKGKALLYNACADAFREEETIMHSFATYTQLASIEGSSLKAPEGEYDDRADSYALALAASITDVNEGTYVW